MDFSNHGKESVVRFRVWSVVVTVDLVMNKTRDHCNFLVLKLALECFESETHDRHGRALSIPIVKSDLYVFWFTDQLVVTPSLLLMRHLETLFKGDPTWSHNLLLNDQEF